MTCPYCGGPGKGILDLPVFTLDQVVEMLDDACNDGLTVEDLGLGDIDQLYICLDCGRAFEQKV